MFRSVAFVSLLLVATAGCSSGSDDASGNGTVAESVPATIADALDIETTDDIETADDSEQQGDSVDSTASGDDVSPADQELCDALSAIVDLNDDMGVATQPLEALAAEGDPDALIEEEADAVADAMDEDRGDIESAYDTAIEAASGEIRTDLELLAGTTIDLIDPMVEVFRDATTFADLAEVETIFDDPEVAQSAVDGGQAALRIDEFAIPTCGFRFSNT